MTLKTTIVLFITFLLSNMLYSQELGIDIIDHYSTKDFDCVIFPASKFPFIGGYTPARKEIEDAEKVLTTDLKKLNRNRINQGIDNSPVIHENLKNYVRQYFGYIDKKGNRYLLIRFIWQTSAAELKWLEKEISVQDGGSYFWSIRYDIKKKRLFDLKINGIG